MITKTLHTGPVHLRITNQPQSPYTTFDHITLQRLRDAEERAVASAEEAMMANMAADRYGPPLPHQLPPPPPPLTTRLLYRK